MYIVVLDSNHVKLLAIILVLAGLPAGCLYCVTIRHYSNTIANVLQLLILITGRILMCFICSPLQPNGRSFISNINPIYWTNIPSPQISITPIGRILICSTLFTWRIPMCSNYQLCLLEGYLCVPTINSVYLEDTYVFQLSTLLTWRILMCSNYQLCLLEGYSCAPNINYVYLKDTYVLQLSTLFTWRILMSSNYQIYLLEGYRCVPTINSTYLKDTHVFQMSTMFTRRIFMCSKYHLGLPKGYLYVVYINFTYLKVIHVL
jgi:hypothetical protein